MLNQQTLVQILSQNVPSALADSLVQSYAEIVRRFYLGDHEPGELNGGKFCEAAYRILEAVTDPNSQYTPLSTSLDSEAITEQLRQIPRGQQPDSIRLYIPRALRAIYDMRSNRGVAHLPDEVDPNIMDATHVLGVCSWVLAEFIRLYHTGNAEQAQAIVDALVERPISIVYEVGGVKRILKPGMLCREQVLVFLYCAHPKWVTDSELKAWTEYGNISQMRKTVLHPLHKERMIEWQEKEQRSKILPPGMNWVEENVDLQLSGA